MANGWSYGMADDIAEFGAALAKLARGIAVNVDLPGDPDGEAFIDLAAPGFQLVVAYRPGFGFGFFDEEKAFGQRPKRFVRSPSVAAREAAEYWRQGSGLVGAPQTIAASERIDSPAA